MEIIPASAIMMGCWMAVAGLTRGVLFISNDRPKWVNGNVWMHSVESRDNRLYAENKELSKEGKLPNTISGV